jgi:hypothetical protein
MARMVKIDQPARLSGTRDGLVGKSLKACGYGQQLRLTAKSQGDLFEGEAPQLTRNGPVPVSV